MLLILLQLILKNRLENNPIYYIGIVPSIVGRIAHKIPLTNNILITPQGDYYYGLRKELENLSLDVNYRRWSVKLGLEYKI